MPAGMHLAAGVDRRPDAEIDKDMLTWTDVSGEKNVWFFWHSGYENMYPYAQRNVRAWFRRFRHYGWTIRVVDRQPSSPFNIANFVDVQDPDLFPEAFTEKTIASDYAPQHESDLVRWPLLLRYGGVYADVGFMQIGDLNRLWEATIGNADSPYEVIAYNGGDEETYALTNYFLASGRDNALFTRCHRLLLALWAEDGGKTTTEGMHRSPLLKGAPMQGVGLSFQENGRTVGPEETSRLITDYIIQASVITMVMGLVDEQDGWNGPEYVANHVFGIEFKVGSQLINEMTGWNGPKAFELMSLPIPREGEVESAEQAHARDIVESCLTRSFGFKLGHGIIFRMLGHTLGTLWRKHEGSDIEPGTYAHWLRYGMVYWSQDELPQRLDFKVLEPFRKGLLLG